MAELNDEINNIDNNDNNMNNINNDDDNIPCRCPKCFLIPSIKLIEEENELKLCFKCENGHEFKEEFNSLYKKSKIKMENIECKKCNNKKMKNKFYICVECKNFYCKKCKNEHRKENNNNLLININKYDSRCKKHNKDLVGYCNEHKKNHCDYCPEKKHDFFKT